MATVEQNVILQSLALGWRDFEDAVQATAAAQAGCQYIITRNKEDFNGSPIPVLDPQEFLKILEAALSD